MAVQDLKLVRWLVTLAKNSPWLMIAAGLHVILAAVMSVVYIHHEMQKANDRDTAISLGQARADAPEVVQPPEEIDRKKIPENEQQAELVTYEEETTFVPTEEVEEDLYQDIGDPTGSDEGSAAETGGTAIGVGVGAGHYGTGTPSAFVSRRASTGLRKKGRPPKGATIGTEEAVLEGLRWLVRHQNPDGSWGVDTLTQRCNPETPCIPNGVEVHPFYNEGLTGLALLAFLGQGVTMQSKIELVDTAMGKRHLLGDVVKRAVRWLIEHQKEDGSFTAPPNRAFLYNESLATMALCEAYGLSRNRELKRPAQKAVDFLIAAQKLGPDGARTGWRYSSRAQLEEHKQSGVIDDAQYYEEIEQVDISVTGWVVMALKSAEICGLDVPREAMEGALAYAQSVSTADGLVAYYKAKPGEKIRGAGDEFDYHTGTMSALGMLVRTFVAHDLNDAFLEPAATHIVKDLPAVSKDKLSVDYYYWYYATLALNQFDGPDSPRKGAGRYWEPWNEKLADAILDLQDGSKLRDVCSRGGWLVNDRWSRHGHALYNTAINVLTLEVYYRYENAFGSAARAAQGTRSKPSESSASESGGR